MSLEAASGLKFILWLVGGLIGSIQALLAVVWFAEKNKNNKTEKLASETKDRLHKDYYTKKETDDRIALYNQPLKESLDRNTEVTEELVKVMRELHADVAVLKAKENR